MAQPNLSPIADMDIDAGAMTRLIDRLAAKGLVERLRSSIDRRVVTLTLTPAGEAVAAHIPQVLAEVDEVRASTLGVSLPELHEALQATIGVVYANDFTLAGRTYRVLVQSEAADRMDAAAAGRVSIGCAASAGATSVSLRWTY